MKISTTICTSALLIALSQMQSAYGMVDIVNRIAGEISSDSPYFSKGPGNGPSVHTVCDSIPQEEVSVLIPIPESDDVELVVFNNLTKEVKQMLLSNSFRQIQLALKDLKEGDYILRLYYNDQIFIGKVVNRMQVH